MKVTDQLEIITKAILQTTPEETDEADEMLSYGFKDQIYNIFQECNIRKRK